MNSLNTSKSEDFADCEITSRTSNQQPLIDVFCGRCKLWFELESLRLADILQAKCAEAEPGTSVKDEALINFRLLLDQISGFPFYCNFQVFIKTFHEILAPIQYRTPKCDPCT